MYYTPATLPFDDAAVTRLLNREAALTRYIRRDPSVPPRKLLHRQLNTINLSFPQVKSVGNPSEELRKIPDKPE
jgi:hypothetical protein